MATPSKYLANMATISNLLCGIFALFLSIQHHFFIAVLVMLLGIIFDVMDGFLARHTNSSSKLGANLDSLADMVTFGIAPLVMLYIYYGNLYVSAAGVILATCGAWRLARHNAMTAEGQGYFIGIPIDTAALLTALIVLIKPAPIIAALCLLLLSFLFISRLKISRPF